MDKRRLLKDLPFGNMKNGTVLTKDNGGYYIDKGETIYRGGGNSDNGWGVLEKDEVRIIDLMWDNPEWCEPATIEHVDIKASRDNILISFKHLDLGQAQVFAKGIQHLLLNYWGKGQAKTWHKLKDFTVGIR